MIVEFSVANFRSIKDKKTLSFEATSQKDYPQNVIEMAGYRLLKSVVLYGANSSGKSNVIAALEKMKTIVNNSFKLSSSDTIDVTPFLLSTETQNSPSFFEILFLLDGLRYRYCFEVDTEQVHSEALFVKESITKEEKMLFARVKDSIEVTKHFKEGMGIEERTKKNTLFLTVVNQFNGEISKKIIGFLNRLGIFSGLHHEDKKHTTSMYFSVVPLEGKIREYLKSLELGFIDFKIEDKPLEFSRDIKTIHKKYDSSGNEIGFVEFEMEKYESAGTIKVFDMAGLIVFSLVVGRIIVIDELDAKLHPLLTQAIVKLFHKEDKIQPIAQLIFTTHDTNLLNAGLFRRDQIYFTEKNSLEETDLYSLAEYKDEDGKKARNDSSLEKNYINGRYGAIPYLGDFSKLFADGKEG